MTECTDRLRVLLVDSAVLWRGAEQQALLLASGLLSRQVDVHVACHPSGDLWARLPAEVPRVPLVMRNDLDLFALPRLLRYCRRRDIQVLAGNTSRDHSITALIRLLDRRRAVVIHRHANYALRGNFGNRLLYQSKYIHTFIPVCDATARLLFEFGVHPDRIVTIRTAVDSRLFDGQSRQTSRARIVQETGAGVDTVLVGVVAALSPEKDYPTLIRALEILKKSQVPFHCLIAGEGVSRLAIDEQIRTAGLDRDITMLGYHKDVPMLMAGLDILALPSRLEGLPNVLLEGMYSGVCVVATRAGGIPEIVRDGETALLSPPGDVPTLADNLTRVIKDPNLRAQLASKGRERARREFSLDRMIDATLAVYCRAASETAAALRPQG